jgi:cell wall-associated NlpC family hydrolase
MADFDPRLTPARPDLAAKHLQGKVVAEKFVDGVAYEIHDPIAPMRSEPRHDAPLDSEALMGERFRAYEVTDEGWAWGQLENDDYVGYLPAGALVSPGLLRTHKVGVLRTLAFSGPSIKSPHPRGLPFGASVEVVNVENNLALTSAGYVPAVHLVPIAAKESDFVAVAERFVGTPYLWGGKTSLGIDCSGLVQVALNACGLPCPRDSDLQEAALGKPANVSDLQRGDLVFWKGHVAIARDKATLVHANAFHMAVALEPVAEAIARIREAGCNVTNVRRL